MDIIHKLQASNHKTILTMQKSKFDIPTDNMGTEVNNIAISVTYQKGGINYFTYKNERRGVYVSIRTEKVRDEGTYTARSFDLFGKMTFKVLAMETARKSQKAIDRVAAEIEANAQEIARRVENEDKEGVRDLIVKVTRNC